MLCKITDNHNDPDCLKEVVKCPRCKKLGHFTKHLNIKKNESIDLFNLNENTRFHVFWVVAHACFAEDRNIGRNISCYIKEDTVGKDEVSLTIRLKNKLPDFVVDKQEDFQDWDSNGSDPYYGSSSEWTYDDDDQYNQGFHDD